VAQLYKATDNTNVFFKHILLSLANLAKVRIFHL